jgi:16S rRNA (cytosine967-C5)-methyltransferase
VLEAQRLASLAVAQVLAGRSLSAVLGGESQKSFASLPQRALAQELIYGTLREYGRLEALASQLLRKPVPSAELRALLAVALYQLERTRAPGFAIVDNAVRAAAKLGQPHAKGLVNAVLRAFLRNKPQLEPALATNEVAQYNHPQWWIDQLKGEYPERFQQILAAGNARPPMTLRVNARRSSAQAYAQRLSEAGIAARIVGSAALTLAQPLPVAALPGFHEGVVSVQDLSAQHAAPLLELSDGMQVLDACAAPGGKTGHILELARVDVLALDHDPERLARVRQNLERLGVEGEVRVADAARPDMWWDGQRFDRILLDVPCSGSGVVKRHPDIKWLRRVADIPQFAAQQARLLDAVWPTLVAHGKLLYVSCSVFGAENDQQIRQFMARHGDARRLPVSFPGDETGQAPGQILPDESRDGFFYALLEKV